MCKFMHQIQNILTEEPDTGILYVRICGGIGGVIRHSIPIVANYRNSLQNDN
jgi:hypothetical protein